MKLNLNLIPERNEEVLASKVASQFTLIFDDSAFQTNSVGEAIWKSIDGVNSIQNIVVEICEKFDVDQESSMTDTINFIHEIEAQGLISIS